MSKILDSVERKLDNTLLGIQISLSLLIDPFFDCNSFSCLFRGVVVFFFLFYLRKLFRVVIISIML